MDRSTRTDYRRPYRPLPIRALNWLGRLAGERRRAEKMSEAALLEQARARQGLQDFGDESFRSGLRRLLESIEGEAHLTPVGRWITRQRLLGMLGNRLRAEKLFRDNPRILELEIRAPVVISGMQRTGTTLLQRLLAADPDNRALASWEAINPAPFLKGGLPARPPAVVGGPAAGSSALNGRADPRLRVTRMSERALAFMAPDFFAVHPVEAGAPEEDVLLLDYSFLSTVPEATLRVPGFSGWLENQDPLPAYREMKKLLQLLQWQRPGRRWVLKSPHHLGNLDALFAVFPDARVIQTHRHPAVTQASFCSMIAHGRGVFSDVVDPHEIGAEWLRKVGRLVRRGMESRLRLGQDRFLDILYHDLVRDPIDCLRRIYDFLAVPFTPELGRRMEEALRANRRDRYGVHRYRLEDFGLTHTQVLAEFSTYLSRFRVPEERDG